MPTPIELATERPGFVIRELATLDDDQAYFDSYNASRAEIAVFDPEHSKKHRLPEQTTMVRLMTHNALRMGMWNHDTFVGSINARPDDDSVEIGYWTDSNHVRQGHATLATRALSNYLRETRTEVFANVLPTNPASRRVLQKAGFVADGRLRQPGHVSLTYRDDAPRLFPFDAPAAQATPRGTYWLVSGDDTPLAFHPTRQNLRSRPNDRLTEFLPGVPFRGMYFGPRYGEKIVSFVYHKQIATGELEVNERLIVLRGVGYGEHPGHAGQPPSWYLAGSQIGTRDPATSKVTNQPAVGAIVPIKHFSLACITGNSLQRLLLANPVEPQV